MSVRHGNRRAWLFALVFATALFALLLRTRTAEAPVATYATADEAPVVLVAAQVTDSTSTFGIEVGDRDDPVAKMMHFAGGLRVLSIAPGSVGSKIGYPRTHR